MGEKWFRNILKTVNHWTRNGKTLSLPPDPSAASLAFDRLTLVSVLTSVTPLAWSLVGATSWLLTPDYGPGLCGLGLCSMRADVVSSPKMPWPCELSPLLSKLSWLDFRPDVNVICLRRQWQLRRHLVSSLSSSDKHSNWMAGPSFKVSCA